MGKNSGKNQKNKMSILRDGEKEKGELIFKEMGQEYAQILRMLGNGRCDTYCFDGVRRLCHIRGKMRKKIWINVGDIVLICLRDFQDHKGDIILKYSNAEARNLKAYGELPANINIAENICENSDDNRNSLGDEGFDFALSENHVSE